MRLLHRRRSWFGVVGRPCVTAAVALNVIILAPKEAFAPAICGVACGAFSGQDFVTDADYLYLLSEYGQQVRGTNKECADSPLTGDGYIEVSDLFVWELYYLGDDACNQCGDGVPPDDGTVASRMSSSSLRSGRAALHHTGDGSFNLRRDGPVGPQAASGIGVEIPPETLLIAGKRSQGFQDALYTLNLDGTCTGDRLSPASAPSPNGYRANGRLARDANGRVFQLHMAQGLIRMSDGQVVLPPSGEPIPFGDKEVYVGVRCNSGAPIGVPLLDVAFHPTDDSVVYVAPVLVVPPGGDAYKAAARLRLTNGPWGFVIEQIYGDEPVNGDGCCNAAPCSSSACSVHHLREVEVYDGRVFVTSSRINGDDWLLVFDEATGTEQARIALDVPSPTAMTITSTGHLFFASALDDQDPTSSELYRYALDESSGVPDLVLHSVIPIDNMRQITAVAENPENGSMWVLGFDAPTFNDDDTFNDNDPLFTTPMLAVVSSGATTATANEITCHDLALPLSMAFNTATCAASSDAEPDGDIDLRDFAAFQNCFRGGSASTKACLVFDIDCDQDIDLQDLRALAQMMTGP